MKNLYSFLLCALLLSSCSDSDNTTSYTLNEESIIGTWVIKVIDGEEQPTDNCFVCRFNADNTQDFLTIISDESGSSFLSSTQGSIFSVENGNITISSSILEMELSGEIASGELCGEQGDIITYTEVVNIQNGVDCLSSRVYQGIRCAEDYSSQIIGVWDGSVIEGDENEPFDNIRLDFKSGSTFDFYYQDTDGSWVILEYDNIYAILGNLFGSQWDDTPTLTIAELWETEISGDTMTWRATREGMANTAGFDLVRVTQ